MRAHSIRLSRSATAVVVLATCVWTSLGGQETPKPGQVGDLATLPLQGRLLTLGMEWRGSLTTSDVRWVDGSFVQAWGLELSRGATVTVDLLSDEFDAYLLIVGPGLEGALSDDDGAGACDARLTLSAPEDGTFRVVANSLTAGATGRFRLRVSEQPGPRTAGECEGFAVEPDVDLVAWLNALPIEGRVIRVGQEAPGELTTADSMGWDDTYHQAWGLDLHRGETATLDLLSDEFDAYLMVVGPGLEEPLMDDDGAGGCDARITFAAPEDGTYRAVVNTLVGATGRFRLRVTDEPGPITGGECEGFGGEDVESVLGVWLAGLPTDERVLAMGMVMSGKLTPADSVSWDGTHVQVWVLELEAGQEATVDLLSADFDSYLMIVGPGLEQVLTDDDGAGACDARLTFAASEAGLYRVAVNTISAGATGEFQLRVTEKPGPVTPGTCGEPTDWSS